MLMLAERLRAQNGGRLDDSAIQAVAEATGVPSEYVRLAVRMRKQTEDKHPLAAVRDQYLALESHVRRYVLTGVNATFCALFYSLGQRSEWMLEQAQRANNRSDLSSPASLLMMISLVWLSLGLYNIAVSRETKVAATSGAILGGGFFAANSFFSFIVGLPANAQMPPILLLPFTVVGAVGGLALQRAVSKNRAKLGLTDPVAERQQLLKQLVDLRDKLESGEQSTTFLSIDIVGSTRMKEVADPLAVEFTFTEYHKYVERAAKKFSGTIHSTAGDGVTCAFEHPAQAFNAAKSIQMGLIELNTFRNKIGVPIRVRQGIHTGTIIAADSGDIRSVNFAHVIDVAAHLQKQATPGSIVVSDTALPYVPGQGAAVGTDRVSAAGVGGLVWVPKVTAAESTSATPPPPNPLPDRA